MAVDNEKIYCVSYPTFADIDKRLVGPPEPWGNRAAGPGLRARKTRCQWVKTPRRVPLFTGANVPKAGVVAPLTTTGARPSGAPAFCEYA